MSQPKELGLADAPTMATDWGWNRNSREFGAMPLHLSSKIDDVGQSQRIANTIGEPARLVKTGRMTGRMRALTVDTWSSG